MDLRYSASDEAFREKLRAWLAVEVPKHGPLPPEIAHDLPKRRVYDCEWQRKLFDAGYAGMGWPQEVGGQPMPA